MAQKATISKKDLLSQFGNDERVVKLESINGSVTIRRLTLAEHDEIGTSGITGIDDNGEPIFDMKLGLMDSKYLTIAYSLVEPKLTVDEVKGMAGAKGFIEELTEEIGKLNNSTTDKKGN